MSEVQSAPMGEASSVTQAAAAAEKMFTGKPPNEKPLKEKAAEPEFKNMTGEEAKAYVESQKTKEKTKPNPVKSAAKEAAAKVQNVPSEENKELVAEAIKKFKVKVDGEDLEVDENELLRGYSHQRAANKILQEGKAARKQAEEFISMMKDPQKFWDTAKKLGHDDRKLAEEFLAKKLEDELMDPRDRELRDVKAELRAEQEQKRLEREALEAQRHEALKKKFAADYTTQFTEALKESKLPPTKEMVSEMARYIQRSAKIGFQMTAKEAAQLVREDIELKFQRIYGQSDAETLVELLKEEGLKKIREFDVKKLKSPEDHLKTPEVQGELKDRKAPSKRMTPAEWRAFNRR